jgi:prophage regulatory protein
MTDSKRRTLKAGAANPGRPAPRNALERAEGFADDLAGLREDDVWNGRLLARFRAADESAVVAMWKSGTNEDGKPLSRFEWMALTERWSQLFGFLPPMDGASEPSSREPEPADTTMLRMPDVVRMTGLSESTIERRYKAGTFPKPFHLSPRRIGWPASKIKQWLAERDAAAIYAPGRGHRGRLH